MKTGKNQKNFCKKIVAYKNLLNLCTALRDVSALKDAREGSIQLFIRNGKAEINIQS